MFMRGASPLEVKPRNDKVRDEVTGPAAKTLFGSRDLTSKKQGDKRRLF
jgi:hypothetical protein